MAAVTKGLVRRVSATTKEYWSFFFKDLPVRALDPEWPPCFNRSPGMYYEYGLIIPHLACF